MLAKRSGKFKGFYKNLGDATIFDYCRYLSCMAEDRSNPKDADRRRHDRLPVQLPITLRYKGRLIPATALNLSCGGMMIDADSPVVDSQGKLEVIFDLSELERDVTLRGEVAWCESIDRVTRVGVRFTNLFTLGHDAVARYLRRRPSQ